MDKLEKLAKQIMKECEQDGEPVTLEEAMEMARMEIGAKDVSVGARVAEPTLEKEKKSRNVKISDEKAFVFSKILENLSENFENVTVLKENKLIEVKYGGKVLKIDLVEQRPPKNK